MFGLDFIRRLKPCRWRYREPLDDGVEHFGFIAQEVDKIASYREYGFAVVNPAGTYGLVLTEFIGPIVKAIQELDERIIKLEKEVQKEKGLRNGKFV